MRNPNPKAIGGIAALMVSALALGAAPSASAGVTGCSAPGGKQEAGAVIGGLLGGVIGNKVGGRHATGETVAGAALGAAAGSAIGCEAQKSRAQNAGTYTQGGYRLSRDIAPARYNRIGDTFVAESAVNLRAAPTANSNRVGRLQPGQRFEALAQVRGSKWILLGQNGVGVGYVHGDFVEPAGRRYAGY